MLNVPFDFVQPFFDDAMRDAAWDLLNHKVEDMPVYIKEATHDSLKDQFSLNSQRYIEGMCSAIIGKYNLEVEPEENRPVFPEGTPDGLQQFYSSLVELPKRMLEGRMSGKEKSLPF